MFSKKLSLVFLVLAIGLSACGAQPVSENPSVNVVQPQPTVVSTQEDVPTAQVEAVSTTTDSQSADSPLSYPVVDTDQGNCYDAQNQIDCPQQGSSFFGQDAQYNGNQPNYTDNSDGTVTDNVTGLMWQQAPGEKKTYAEAVAGASNLTLAGHSDWRLPTIKELYSLIQFDGLDPSGPSASTLVPFIDTDYFNFEYGDESAGERIIDSQWATSSIYGDSVMNGQQAMFGVNFADGRIKGYPTSSDGRGPTKTYFVIYVRGNTSYGDNNFADNGDGTVSDNATGLTWTQNDSASGMNWDAALNYCESLDYAGSSDWRLPNVKELQSIVDYSRAPGTTNSAAIDPIFNTSSITNEAGQVDYPTFWSSTTHANLRGGTNASYVSFGRAMGNMNGSWMDVHGAGAQRSDPKTGSASDWPTGHGPQGDAIRVDNYVRCVTDGGANSNVNGNPSTSPSGGESNTQPPAEQQPQAQSQPTGPQGQGPDLAAVAAELGVTEEVLAAALGAPPPDFAATAAQLGVTEEALIAALGLPAGGSPNSGGPPPPSNQP